MEAQILSLRSAFESEESEALKIIGIEKVRSERFEIDRAKMAKSRKGDIHVERKTPERPGTKRRKRVG